MCNNNEGKASGSAAAVSKLANTADLSEASSADRHYTATRNEDGQFVTFLKFRFRVLFRRHSRIKLSKYGENCSLPFQSETAPLSKKRHNQRNDAIIPRPEMCLKAKNMYMVLA